MALCFEGQRRMAARFSERNLLFAGGVIGGIRNGERGGLLLWTLETESTPDGDRLTVRCDRHSDVDALVELVKNGLTSARDIAAELDVTPGTVSKWAKKAEAAGRIRIEGRQYLPAA